MFFIALNFKFQASVNLTHLFATISLKSNDASTCMIDVTSCCSHNNYRLNDHWFGLMRGLFDDCFCLGNGNPCDQCRGYYVWTDLTTMSYNGWSGPQEPGVEDCARMTGVGWKAESCDTMLQFYCTRGQLTVIHRPF